MTHNIRYDDLEAARRLARFEEALASPLCKQLIGRTGLASHFKAKHPGKLWFYNYHQQEAQHVT